jgi:hypothetical protein
MRQLAAGGPASPASVQQQQHGGPGSSDPYGGVASPAGTAISSTSTDPATPPQQQHPGAAGAEEVGELSGECCLPA